MLTNLGLTGRGKSDKGRVCLTTFVVLHITALELFKSTVAVVKKFLCSLLPYHVVPQVAKLEAYSVHNLGGALGECVEVTGSSEVLRHWFWHLR